MGEESHQIHEQVEDVSLDLERQPEQPIEESLELAPLAALLWMEPSAGHCLPSLFAEVLRRCIRGEHKVGNGNLDTLLEENEVLQ